MPHEGIAQSIYYKWSKECLEAGKRRLADDTARAASTGEVIALRREARELKEAVAEQTLKFEIIRLVEQWHRPVKRTLDKLGVPRTAFYRGVALYQIGGVGRSITKALPSLEPYS